MTTQTNELKSRDIVKVNGNVGYAIRVSKDVFGFWNGKGNYSTQQLPVIEHTEEISSEEKITLLRNLFVWGIVEEIYVLKKDYEYVIFEYKDSKDETLFHTFLNFKDMNRGYLNFDSAMLGLLEHKYQGNDSRAAEYCERILEMKD